LYLDSFVSIIVCCEIIGSGMLMNEVFVSIVLEMLLLTKRRICMIVTAKMMHLVWCDHCV